jgi:histone H3/H4
MHFNPEQTKPQVLADREQIVTPKKRYHGGVTIVQIHIKNCNMSFMAQRHEFSNPADTTNHKVLSLCNANCPAKALKEIKFYQKQTGTIIPRTLMRRICLDLIADQKRTIMSGEVRISEEACAALHLAAETYLLRWFEMVYNLLSLFYLTEGMSLRFMQNELQSCKRMPLLSVVS